MSPASRLPKTGIGSRTLLSAIEYGVPFFIREEKRATCLVSEAHSLLFLFIVAYVVLISFVVFVVIIAIVTANHSVNNFSKSTPVHSTSICLLSVFARFSQHNPYTLQWSEECPPTVDPGHAASKHHGAHSSVGPPKSTSQMAFQLVQRFLRGLRS